MIYVITNIECYAINKYVIYYVWASHNNHGCVINMMFDNQIVINVWKIDFDWVNVDFTSIKWCHIIIYDISWHVAYWLAYVG